MGIVDKTSYDFVRSANLLITTIIIIIICLINVNFQYAIVASDHELYDTLYGRWIMALGKELSNRKGNTPTRSA